MARIRPVLRGFFLLVLVLVVAGAALFWAWRRSGRPQREGEARIARLSVPAEVRYDARGIPMIEAASSADAMAALGWVHANDRLFQMELTRRAAVGRLAEIFGERALDYDRRVRRTGVVRMKRRLYESAGSSTRALLEAYASGVNAWLEARGSDLPPEFRLLGHRPEPWRPEDSISVIAVMARSLSPVLAPPEEELFRLLRAFGPERARELAVDPDAEVFPDLVELAASTPAPPAKLDDRLEGADLGSNSWVVAPSRAATGSALLANDPHLGIGLPNVWYAARIRSPDYDALGMTFPGAPAVVLGRGPNVAWGCTNLYVDDLDVVFEELDAAGTRVRRGDGWAEIEREVETIAVKDEAPVELEVRWTDRGPLLPADEARGLPPRSLMWTGHRVADQLDAFLSLARARTLDDVPAGIAGFVFPAQNLVVASANGGILWTPIGQGPRRVGWDGRFPVLGRRTDLGWDGLVPAAENPVLRDPEVGRIATANSDLPVPTPAWFSDRFDTPFRLHRIEQRLDERTDWTVESLVALQDDTTSLWARRVVAELGAGYEGDAARALAALRAWDGDMRPLGPSALFALLERDLQRRVFEDEAQAEHLPRFGTRERLLALLEERIPPAWFDDVATDGVEDRHAILGASLAAAWAEAERRFGPGIERWSYGGLHRLVLDHALGRAPLVGGLLSRGPYAMPGSATTVAAFGGPWKGDAMDVTYGPSMRFVTDAARPDESRSVLPGGQSGHPFDVHYDDQIADYLAGRSGPLAWSVEAIRAAEVSRVVLRP